MSSLFSASSILRLLLALLPCIAIVFAWRRRSAPGAFWLLMLLFASAEWTLTAAIAWMNIDIATRIVFAKLSYVGSTTASVFLLLFALEYTGRVVRVSRDRVAELLVIPLACTFAAASNESHWLIWTSVERSLVSPDVLVFSHGPLFWLVTVYGFVISMAATVLFVGFAMRSRRLYRDQSIAVAFAVLIPWVAFVIYITVPNAFIWFDPSMTVGVSAAILTFALMRYHLLDLVPVARDALVEQMPEGLIVIDSVGRIVDLNPAAHRLLGVSDGGALGRPLGEALEGWPQLAQELAESPMNSHFVSASSWGTHVSIQTWPLGELDGHSVGIAALLSDVSAQVRTETVIGDARTRLDSLVGEIEDIETGFYGAPRQSGTGELS